MAVWVTAMAVSRMYLGRHFLGDVLGGFGVGVVVTAMGLQALNLGRFSAVQIEPARAQRMARRVLVTAAALAACALALAVPDLREASRLLGIAMGVMLLVLDERVSNDAPVRVRVGRVVLAAVLFPLVWWSVSRALNGLVDFDAPLRALLAGALPVAVLLPGAVYAGRVSRTLRQRVT